MPCAQWHSAKRNTCSRVPAATVFPLWPYILIGTAKLHDIHRLAYLRHVLTLIANYPANRVVGRCSVMRLRYWHLPSPDRSTSWCGKVQFNIQVIVDMPYPAKSLACKFRSMASSRRSTPHRCRRRHYLAPAELHVLGSTLLDRFYLHDLLIGTRDAQINSRNAGMIRLL